VAADRAPARARIGLDVGGTFTDLFLLDQASGRAVRHKLPSTPADPYQAPVQGLREILRKAGIAAAEVEFIGLGTTVATNGLLERKGAVTALVTTKGFRDLLEIGRQRRPHPYDLFKRKVDPLVPRQLRFEVDERIAADGSVIASLDDTQLAAIVEQLERRQVQSVAVCLLNSYADPRHERQIAGRIRERLPAVSVTASHELIPEFREFERLSSTVINAYLMPVMKRYLTRFTEEVAGLGVKRTPYVMNSGGGIVSPALASARPIDMLLSGPSGGVSGALYLAQLSGHPNIITFDMGGTSTDVCLIQDSRAEITHGRTINAFPIRSTAVDVHTVGAGGSSIAWIDAGGMLRVGPHSAGANPGPACYGRDGAQPTVTDANVALGRLNQEYLLDGALRIDASRSLKAIEQLARVKGLDVLEAAAAILAISNTNIAQAIRFVSVERGLDPADFTLVAFGGAGPLHAAEVARELNMTVLIPPAPGVLCAMGVLTKDIQIDVSQTRLIGQADPQAGAQLQSIFESLEQRAVEMLKKTDIGAAQVALERTVDVRYRGQNFELTVPAPAGGELLEAVRASFDAAHERMYGYAQPQAPIELVTFRVKASLPTPRPKFAADPAAGAIAVQPRAQRRTYFEAIGDFVTCPVFARDDLPAGVTLQGPAIVEQMDTTIVVPPDFEASADGWGNLLLRCTHRTPQ
jgi:N-methylhydantoinase A